MKKKILYALLIAVGICLVGCGKKPELENTQENTDIQDEELLEVDDEDVETEESLDDSETEIPEYYATYAELLHQFMNGKDAYFMNNDHAVSYIEQDGVSCSQDFSFGLYDINKDDIEELIVVDGKDFLNGGVANIIIPKEKWSDANIGEISYIDVNSGKVASLISDLGDAVTYYDFTGDKLIEYDCFRYEIYVEGDDCLYQNNTYYHGKDNNKVISEEEYNNQDAFIWDRLDISFYYLSEENINLILGDEIIEDINTDWKQAYMPIIEQWDNMHCGDNNYGYDLIYIDNNDIPELVLVCDDEAFVAYDIYTCIDGKAVRLRYEDDSMNQRVSNLVSPGCQGKSDSYIERKGIYMQDSGMMSCYGVDGYVLEEGVLKNAFTYFYHDTSWDETIAEPYGYTIEYINRIGRKITNEVVTDGDYKYYDIINVPESIKIEEIYNFKFENSKAFEGSMDYKTISNMLGMDEEPIDISEREKFAKLLYQYMTDDTKGISEGMDGFSYQYNGGKFMLTDVNGDGIEEMLLTVMGMEYSLFAPKDTWEEAYLCNITGYSNDGILERDYGSTFSSIHEYKKYDGNKVKELDYYESFDNDMTGAMEYIHRNANGDEKTITEVEFKASASLYNTHDVEGKWYDISEENIAKYLMERAN